MDVVTADFSTETQDVVSAELTVVHRNIEYVNMQPEKTTEKNDNKNALELQCG